MADWSLPSLSSSYANFLAYLKGRDDDAVRLNDSRATAPTNPVDHAKKWNDTTKTFESRLSGIWNALILSIAGGGTGAATAAGARTNLDVYSKSEADANYAVPITTETGTLTSSVLMVTAGTYYDGPSVSLSPGTWFVHAFAYFQSSGGTPDYLVQMKLCSSTTVYAGAAMNTMTENGASMSVSAIITLGATTTIKLSAKCGTSGVVYIYPSAAETNDGTHINALKIG